MLSFSPGDSLYRAGDASKSAFLIRSGEIEVTFGRHKRILTQGEICGGLSLIRGKAHEDTAIAKTAGEAEELSLAQVEELVSQLQAGGSAAAQPSQTGDNSQAMMAGMERFANMIGKCCEAIEQKLGNLAPPPITDDEIQEIKEISQSDLGPLAPLVADDTINDILINGPDNIFIERSGLLEKTNVKFKSDKELFAVAKNIARDIGRRIDITRPLIDARLLDGSRVNIIAPPLAVDGTSISIRKFSKKNITLDNMQEKGNLNKEICEFLKVVGKCRLNIVISGGTGSGKTTLLNAISQFIEKEERIVTIEDAAELKLQQPHVVRLETKPHHLGMKAGEDVTIRDLVKNALRMRPDRIIVGEVRGPEAFDMLQAMNTGHEGSLTTVHANHPRDALSRLENMISMADLQIPIKSLRYQIASALHLVVQISRMRDGHRRVTYISEVVGMEGDMITMHDLFTYKTEGEDETGKIVGKFKWSGIVPRFVRRVEYYGDLARLETALGVKFPKVMNLGKQK